MYRNGDSRSASTTSVGLFGKHQPFTNVGLVLKQRLRRWSNTKPALYSSYVFVGEIVLTHG